MSTSSNGNLLTTDQFMRSSGALRMVIYAETFLAVTACVYMSMICMMHMELVEDMSPVIVWPYDVAHDSAVESFRRAEMCGATEELWHLSAAPTVEQEKEDECEMKRSSRFTTLGTSFVIAFMAGGFMNLERVQGLPLP